MSYNTVSILNHKRGLPLCAGNALCFLVIFFVSCGTGHQEKLLFEKISPAVSGIVFSNTLSEMDSSYSFINEFGYMGGGVGIGDFNNDGLKDIYFTGNQVSSRLYLNKGNNRFEDITTTAGVGTNVWCAGVSVADVNNDGYDDIYVCVFGKDLVQPEKNLLFINQQNLQFKEEAGVYGLADTGNSTQAAFFDYDRDGDLDMYLANYLLSENNANSIFPKDNSGRSPANDRLYRNEGTPAGVNHPVFTDVTLGAGIREDGYGLGIAVSDYNNDNWPDIYVANDFLSNDELWLNNKNGTFANVIAASMQHQSYSSMGADAADLNNDALTDIVTLDMLPETNERRKLSFSIMNYERYETERSMGYEPEFVRNMLQLNNGTRLSGDTAVPHFSEIGQYAGIHATDWSWSVLMPDIDLDGWKDIHITNGIGRDFINGDFLAFSGGVFSSSLSKEEKRKAIRNKLAALDHVRLSNYVYLNNRDHTFTDVSALSGANEPSMSNGAAYADIDNDGDLDLIVNNINAGAFVLLNRTRENNTSPSPHFITVRLKGDSLNPKAIGAKVLLYRKGETQLLEQYPVRGYFSSVDTDLHFGLGTDKQADSILITWPRGQTRLYQLGAVDSIYLFSEKEGVPIHVQPAPGPQALFTETDAAGGILFSHVDVPFNDYTEQRLLPQKFSQQGPRITTGDVNNDGEMDFFAGGGFNFPGELYIKQKGAGYAVSFIGDSIKWQEDMDCRFLDTDGDRDLDLLITYGDTRYDEKSVHYIPSIYRNDGKGNFRKYTEAFSDSIRVIAGCVAEGDYDKDGDLDLFIGGRVSKRYPLAPRSYLLQNNNGVFTDVTQRVCGALLQPGMVTAAVWTDYDKDKNPDLVIAGEWMPLRFFSSKNGVLIEKTAGAGTAGEEGLWRCIKAADADNDGDIDIIAGNLGLNCDYRCSPETPLELFATDMDKNGSIDPVPFYYLKNKEGKRQSYPALSLPQLGSQVPSVFKKFLYYKDYAQAGYKNLFGHFAGKDVLHLRCTETRTCWFENTGKGSFVKHPLPGAVQFAPVNAILCNDFDKDGKNDLLLAGNEYQTEIITGRFDASYGQFLKGLDGKRFKLLSSGESGFFIRGDVRDIALLDAGNNRQWILAAVNAGRMRVFEIRQP